MKPLHKLILVGLVLALLAAGCGQTAASLPTLTPVPTDTATPFPTQAPRPTATPTRTPLPTLTPVDPDTPPTGTPTPLPTPEIIEGAPPPLDLALPPGWNEGYIIAPVQDRLTVGGVPVAVYTGPVPDLPGATGWLVIFWGYPSISATGRPDPWADGLRLLRGALLDSSCSIGTDLQRNFSVGGREDAVGTYFSAVGCHGEPDTAGWFAGLNEQGGNYVFFAYADPIDAYEPSIPALQAILDSVAWHAIPTLTPGP